MLEWIISSTIAVSLLSLLGVVFLSIKENTLKKMLVFLVAFAVGGMLGGALFHLLPEALAEMDALSVFVLVSIGFMLFFIVEKFLHWRHCHDNECEIHNVEHKETTAKNKVLPVAYLNLIGDGIHNFMDGAVIAAAFMTNIQVGIASTIAIVLHEIPQEIGDFGVLVHSGLEKKKALFYNLLSGLTSVIGAIITYIFLINIANLTSLLLPIAAGGFIYIAAVDLVPELHKERKPVISVMQLVAVVIGIWLMYYMKVAIGG
ncbi:MAG: ZIP family metal transporter [Candidatus Micrarchaeia archaeon]